MTANTILLDDGEALLATYEYRVRRAGHRVGRPDEERTGGAERGVHVRGWPRSVVPAGVRVARRRYVGQEAGRAAGGAVRGAVVDVVVHGACRLRPARRQPG